MVIEGSRRPDPNPTFVPDVAGHYAFRLRATSDSGVSITTTALDAANDPRHRSARHYVERVWELTLD